MAKAKQKETWPKVVETFGDPSWSIGRIGGKEPSCWNGTVSVTRYRITIERIEDPIEVIAERLQHLWDHCDNLHHSGPLKSAAQKFGIELVGESGSKVVRKHGGA